MASNNSDHRGKFHLLSVALIPVNLLAWFMTENWFVGLITSIISVIIIYLLIFRKPI